jgi:hypothetical protein
MQPDSQEGRRIRATGPRDRRRFLGARTAAKYSALNILKQRRCEGKEPRFHKMRVGVLYDVRDLDEFILSGIRLSSVRASREEPNVALSTR